MKKKIALTSFIAAIAAILVAPAAHAFQSVARTTVTAKVTTDGSKTASVSVAIKNVNDPFGASQPEITWSGVNPPDTEWKIADQFLVLNATVTDALGGVQIYTRNTDPDAAPSWVDPTPSLPNNADSNPAGLLKGASGTTSETLPYAWSIKGTTKTVGVDLLPADPNTGPETGDGNRYQWNYGSDRATPSIPETNTNAFVDGDSSVTVINVTGIHGVQGPAGFFAHPDGADSSLYLQANFDGAAAQQAYQTSTLTVESYIE